jgi:hypothetical protein
MESQLEGVIRADREPGAGAPDGSGHDDAGSFGKGLLWGLFLSGWLWWVIWLCIRAFSASV